jgi:glycosyltransferase involved in cell wall biosynthesis
MWSYESGSWLRPLLDRQVIARGADAFVAVSREGVRGMVERERIPPGKIVYVPNGVRPLPGGDGARARAAFGLGPEVPLIVSVGHLRPEKAFETLVEALARLRASGTDARALIAGEGPERARLERLARERGVADALLLPGARDDIADILDAAQVAVCCSRFEGGPLSVMEYFQAGLPVVASRVGGLPELVADGVSGVLVPAADPEALAAAASGLLADPERRRRFGAAGAELVRRDYSIDVWLRRLRTLYGELLDRGRPQPRL